MNERIDRFLFAEVDARWAAVFRGLLAVALATIFWPEERPLMGRVAALPGAATLWDTLFLTPLWWSAALVALAAFGAGLGGRKAAWCALLLLLPLLPLRAAMSRQALWLALLAFSLLPIDRRWPWRGSDVGTGPIWPLRLVQIQLSLLYAANVWAKLSPEYLRGDVLVGLSQVMPNFLVDLSDGFLHLGPLAVPAWACAVGTVAIEAALALGFWWPRLRVATAALGVGFHLSLQWVLTIGWLDWTCMFLYLAFLLPLERTPHDAGPSR